MRKRIAAGIVAAWSNAAAMPWAEDLARGDDRALDALSFHRLSAL
jgi:hypothetical protein